jgi:hypothetical protein
VGRRLVGIPAEVVAQLAPGIHPAAGGRYKNLRLVHLPVHAWWLNQISAEIYFSWRFTLSDLDRLLRRLGETGRSPRPHDHHARTSIRQYLEVAV